MVEASERLEQIIEECLSGRRITEEECLLLFEGADLLLLGEAAHRIRQKKCSPDIITYVVDRNINYTNICISGCAFCAFSTEENSPEAYLLDTEEVLIKVEEAVALGATQILMQGGLHPTFSLEQMEELIFAIKAKFQVQVHSLSPPEIVHLAKLSDCSIETTLRRLREAGLDSLPGGGAEILSERIRRQLSPRKCTAEEWLEVMRIAHQMGMPTTATMMFGHVESYQERVEHLSRIRELQDETGGFTAFIPWTYQSQNTRLGGESVGGYDYLRTLAISRLFLDNFLNLQASWVTQGLKIGQIALFYGANDFGSTMIEENVVRAAGADFSTTEGEIRRAIGEAGFKPIRRTTLYEPLEMA